MRSGAVSMDRFRRSLSDIWVEPGYMRSVAARLSALIPSSSAFVYDLRDDGTRGDVGHLLSSAGNDWASVPGHENIPGLARYRFRPGEPLDRWANRAVETRRLYDRQPEQLAMLREKIIAKWDAHYQLRVVLYDRSQFRGLCAVVREERQGEFTQEDRMKLQRVTPALLDGFRAVRALGSKPLARVGLVGVLDAFDQPAYVLTERGNVVHRNAAAAVNESVPDWLGWIVTVSDDPQAHALAQLHPLEIEGQRFWLVVPRASHPGAGVRDELPPALDAIAEHLVRGLSDKEIASKTGRPIATVRTYVQRLYARLGVHSRYELIARLRGR